MNPQVDEGGVRHPCGESGRRRGGRGGSVTALPGSVVVWASCRAEVQRRFALSSSLGISLALSTEIVRFGGSLLSLQYIPVRITFALWYGCGKYQVITSED